MSHSSDTPIHILVVEDEGVTALDTWEQLESLGYAVTTAAFLMDIRLKGRVAAQYAAEGRRRQVRLQMTLDESLPLVAADPVAVEQIVTNLVFNGLKFTPQGGTVTISSRTRRPEIVLTVADTGPGIPAEHLPRLFDRYQPVAAAHLGGGTGLGLFIVKTLAEGHEGRVEVASAPGEGSRFSVILPAVGPTGADAAAGA